MNASSIFTLDVDRRRSILSNQETQTVSRLVQEEAKYTLLFRIPRPGWALHNTTVIKDNMIERFMIEKKWTIEA